MRKDCRQQLKGWARRLYCNSLRWVASRRWCSRHAFDAPQCVVAQDDVGGTLFGHPVTRETEVLQHALAVGLFSSVSGIIASTSFWRCSCLIALEREALQ